MAIWDSISKAVEDQAPDWLSNFAPAMIQSTLQKTGLVVAPTAPKSNLTAKEVAAGQKGAIDGIPSISQGGMPSWLLPVAILGGGGLILALVMKRRK